MQDGNERYNGLFITNSRFESGTIHPTQVTIDDSPLATKADLAAKQNTLPAGTSTQYLRGDLTMQTLNKAAVGLGNADNTTDLAKPISTATQTALNAKANLASPALTGTPTAPTQASTDNSTRLATTAFVATGLAAKQDKLTKPMAQGANIGANVNLNDMKTTGWYQQTMNANTSTALNYPEALAGTLYVLNDGIFTVQKYYTYPTASPKTYERRRHKDVWGAWKRVAMTDSPAFTGTPTAPTQASTDNSTKLATTAFVKSQDYATNTSIKGGALLEENGYAKLPSGLIIQWGWQPKPAGESLAKFALPTPFPNKFLNASAIIHNDLQSHLYRCDYWVQLRSFSNTHIEFYMQGSGALYEVSRFYWQALGY